MVRRDDNSATTAIPGQHNRTKIAESPCTLRLRLASYSDGRKSQELECWLDHADTTEGRTFEAVTLNGSNLDMDYLKKLAYRGDYQMFANNSVIDFDTNQITISSEPQLQQIKRLSSRRRTKRRRLLHSSKESQIWSVLVVRIGSPNDERGYTKFSANQLHQFIFDDPDGSSLTQNFERCSYNQTRFEPAVVTDIYGTTTDNHTFDERSALGVYTVHLAVSSLQCLLAEPMHIVTSYDSYKSYERTQTNHSEMSFMTL